jgi:hypothetical protein
MMLRVEAADGTAGDGEMVPCLAASLTNFSKLLVEEGLPAL